MMKKEKKINWREHKEALFFAYFILYLVWFFALEQRGIEGMHLVTNPLDSYIPFCEYFVIPYYLWFVYLYGGCIYFYFKDRKGEFVKMMTAMEVGLTICLIIYTFFPNWQDLRPEVYPNNNVFTQVVKMLQGFDTPTNVCPSIHVFGTIVMHIAVMRRDFGKHNRIIKATSLVLAISVCLSTVFLKQHSVTDMLWGFVLNAAMYVLVYKVPGLWRRRAEKAKPYVAEN